MYVGAGFSRNCAAQHIRITHGSSSKRKIPARDLAGSRALEELPQRITVEANVRNATNDANGCRNRSIFAHHALELCTKVEIRGIRPSLMRSGPFCMVTDMQVTDHECRWLFREQRQVSYSQQHRAPLPRRQGDFRRLRLRVVVVMSEAGSEACGMRKPCSR